MTKNNDVLSRVLEEVKASASNDCAATSHFSYVSGVFEEEENEASVASNSQVLDRVLEEVKASKNADAITTSHTSYVSGVFEEV